ncbi:Asp-tRNAAsn/Glu-tRNAGln amidotransferase A subunit or related amidase (GatA) (PDB:3H0L) [Commensalibacter communis]|uniref:Glutamyl-tRNA(Gln) amidotransferase subunit A n=1 Tax=Commensalibacter communis TaxID=2972786 RepID=A0A9W4X7Q5_9PROT|nr:Asp-tRNA(Asn)/Glu-tRNA(Gln) amidotransferase subunit GatA [Commensalibacter communis]CAI3952007.1 Asp-tRNAAsn/Glu-tRNAGln amidotransferase A subunit or related amidase (GatA) (PDB:3H0L) [Commensalibacter communis]CAI3956940.1 Asp-tRNAAsn/Glu-tRNAGln amidotransferase A subunit or related amidase (GatA) (PDB:3H0L) [Commensalibacter communis]CAI3958318.1 Asp-tRNAAsn/Glu-tRNAGln amidotransferase A subunit or related amidase (GatA) (PDB:3H0L) [Commensalibacter communis]CAI3959029.1 Asp-tRNAAsn/Gl
MLTGMKITEAVDGLRQKKFSAEELTKAHVNAINKLNDRINAYITVTADAAIEQAKAADQKLAAGDAPALTGIPLAIKDLFCTKGVKTTAASRILENFVPPYESTVTANLLRDGAVFLGKVNLDEFAMGSGNLNSAFGAVENPWKRQGEDTFLVPGGSSGGSAAAVAAQMAMGATGTDTGGSIRQPAAYCGITGIKPTYGRCSRWGIIAYASSLDQAGPMGKSVEDCAIMLQSMAGFDPKDSTSVDKEVPDYRAACNRSLKGMKVGIPMEYRVPGLSPEIEAVWQQGINWLKEAGCEIVDVSLPHTKHGLATYYIIAPAEASSNLARYDGVRYGRRVDGASLDELYANTRGAGFGDEVKRRILMGTYVLSAGYYDAYYLRAQKVRKLINQDFMNVFDKVDVLLTPTAPTAAFAKGENQEDPVQMYLNDIFTVPASMAGVPGLALPAGLSSQGLPLGLQLLGRPFGEETLFAVGSAMEKAANFTHKPTLRAGGSL